MSKTSQRRASKPKQQKLLVKRMWFKPDDLFDPAADFYAVTLGDLESDGRTCLAKEYWRINLRGWWSFTLTFYGYDDQNQTGERAVNFRPEVMLTPKTIIQRVKENFDAFVEANEDFNAVGSVAMITISNRKPVSVYGGES
jgi:hypothetical protein